MAGKKEIAKKMIGWDHPFVGMGFVPEHLLQEVLQLDSEYFRRWQGDNDVPGIPISGVRWFHRDQLASWFCAEALKPKPKKKT